MINCAKFNATHINWPSQAWCAGFPPKKLWYSVCMAVLLCICIIVFAGLKARVPISTKIGSSKPFPKLPSPQLYERWSHHHAAREARHSSAAFMEFFGDQTRKLGLTMARSRLWSRVCLNNWTKHSRTVRQWTTQKMCVGGRSARDWLKTTGSEKLFPMFPALLSVRPNT